MIVSRDPVHSALWFAAVVLSTSGLFLLAGAQFLAAGTVIVYAGAIIVTFLFVIMLAQQQGQALYDRSSRSPARASLTCFMLAFGLLYSLLMATGALPIGGVKNKLTRPQTLAGSIEVGRGPTDAEIVLARAVPATARTGAAEARPKDGSSATGRPPKHVAGLGGTLFTDNLFASEAVGVLLFISLVGAISLATARTPQTDGSKRNPEGP